jgi:multiple sugar transport system substrate-binding protein
MQHRKVLLILMLMMSLFAMSIPLTAQEPVTVTIFVGLGTGTAPAQIEAQEALAERFNSEHEDIQIEFLIVPVEESGTRLLTMMTDPSTAPQLVGPNGISTIAQFFDSWADVSPFIETENFDTSDFYAPSLELNAYPDKVTGLPLGLFPSFLLYNQDAFDAAGVEYPPSDFEDTSWTWDELRNRAMLITLDENFNNATMAEFDPDAIIQWGFDDSWTDGRGTLTRWGAPDVGRPTNGDYTVATANSEEWVAGLQWISDGIHVDHFIPNADGVAAYESAGLGTPLDGGLIGMFHSHTWYLAELGDAYGDLPFTMQLAPLPFNANGERIARIHADNFTIPATAQHQEEAWEVMKWLTSEEVIMDVCVIYGCIPARQSVADEYRTILEERFPGLDFNVVFESINYLDNPNHESWVPEWTQVNDTMNFAFQQVFFGENTDAQAVLDEANAQIQALLDAYHAGE